MASETVSQLEVLIRAEINEFVAAMRQATEAMRQFSAASASALNQTQEKAEEAEKKTKSAFQRMADGARQAVKGFKDLGVVVAAGAVPLGLAVHSMIGYERQMRNVNSILHLSEDRFKGLYDQVLAMARDPSVYHRPVELAQALYQAASAGYDAEKGLELVQSASVGAMAGTANLADTLKVLISVQRSGIKGGEDLGHSLDVLFRTVELGIVEFSDLANTLGYVTPIAATAGVSLEEVSAYLALATLRGLDAESAVTALKNVIMQVLNPSAQAKKIFKELGIEFGASAFKAKGLIGVLSDVAQIRDPDVIAALFGDMRAFLGAVTPLAGEGMQEFARLLDSITNSAGAAQSAADQMRQSLGVQLEQLRAKAEALGIKLLNSLIPHLRSLVNWADKAVNSLQKLNEQTGGGAAAFGKFLVGVGLVITAINAMAFAVGKAKSAWEALKGAVKFVAGIPGALAKVWQWLVGAAKWTERVVFLSGRWYAVLGRVLGVAGLLYEAFVRVRSAFFLREWEKDLQKEFLQKGFLAPEGGYSLGLKKANLPKGISQEEAKRLVGRAHAALTARIDEEKKKGVKPLTYVLEVEAKARLGKLSEELVKTKDIRPVLERRLRQTNAAIADLQKKEKEALEKGNKEEAEYYKQRRAALEDYGGFVKNLSRSISTQPEKAKPPITTTLDQINTKLKESKSSREKLKEAERALAQASKDTVQEWVNQAREISNLDDRLQYLKSRLVQVGALRGLDARERRRVTQEIKKEIQDTEREIWLRQLEIQNEQLEAVNKRTSIRLEQELHDIIDKGGPRAIALAEGLAKAYQRTAEVLPSNIEAYQKMYEYQELAERLRKEESEAAERMAREEFESVLRLLEGARAYDAVLSLLMLRHDELVEKMQRLRDQGASAKDVADAYSELLQVNDAISDAQSRIIEQQNEVNRAAAQQILDWVGNAKELTTALAEVEESIRRELLPKEEAEHLERLDQIANKLFRETYSRLDESGRKLVNKIVASWEAGLKRIEEEKAQKRLGEIEAEVRLTVREREIKRVRDQVAREVFEKAYSELTAEQKVKIDAVINTQKLYEFRNRFRSLVDEISQGAKNSLREAAEAFFTALLSGEKSFRNAFKQLVSDIKRLIIEAVAKIIVEALARRLREILGGVIGRKDKTKSAFDAIAEAGKEVGFAILGVAAVLHQGRVTLGSVIKTIASMYLIAQGQKTGKTWMQVLGAVLGTVISGFLQTGGVAEKNKVYVVGERGPELFIPGVTGRVEPIITRPEPRPVNVSVNVHIGMVNRQVDLDKAWRDLGWAVRAAITRA